jgi:hypothetical protein
MISNEAENAECAPKRRKPRARKVFVLVGVWDYEGSAVVGVCSTKRRAEKAMMQCDGAPGTNRCSHDDHEIQPFTVNL